MTIQTANELRQGSCKPCEGGVDKFDSQQAAKQLEELPEWQLNDSATMISRKWERKNFADALAFVNKIGEIAESDQHHPNLHIVDYKIVKVELTTHAIGGLSENDFILAAKIDGVA